MKIERKNFRFDNVVDISSILDNLHLFYMEQIDIDEDDNVRGEVLDENESLFVLYNVEETTKKGYCYVKIKEKVGQDGITKALIVKKVIVDNNLIGEEIFKRMFLILLQQNDDTLTNRIIVPNRINRRFHKNIPNIVTEISTYITWLYSTYTEPLICPSYEVD